MENFTEFRRKFAFNNNLKKNKKNNTILSERNSKKENSLKLNIPNSNYSSKHFHFRKNQNSESKNYHYNTVNTIFTNKLKIDELKKPISSKKKLIYNQNKILNNHSSQKDKISSNITTDSTVNLTENYSSCKSLSNIKINKKLDILKERCIKLFTKYDSILNSYENYTQNN